MGDAQDLARTARLDVLVEGYARLPHVAGTVCLVRDGDRVVVVDPGMVASREDILAPLRDLGVAPADVTDVVVSHHHLDHTVNIALFQNDFKNLQVSQFDGIAGLNIVNAGKSRSRGIEVDARWRPIDMMTLGAMVALFILMFALNDAGAKSAPLSPGMVIPFALILAMRFGGRPVAGSPKYAISPAAGLMKPISVLSSVDLPMPFLPSTATTSPR